MSLCCFLLLSDARGTAEIVRTAYQAVGEVHQMSILAWIAASGSQLSSDLELGKIIVGYLAFTDTRSNRRRIFTCCVALTPLRVGLRSQTGASEGLLG